MFRICTHIYIYPFLAAIVVFRAQRDAGEKESRKNGAYYSHIAK